MSTQPDFPEWLAEAAIGLATGDVDTWMKMYADDAVHEFPFAAPGEVRALHGRSEIHAYMSRINGSVRFGSLDGVTVQEAGDDVIIEADGHHFDAVTGEPFDLQYLWIITRRDERVMRLRDYMSPRRTTSAQN
jgi:ketosteroid isomerase-like protein